MNMQRGRVAIDIVPNKDVPGIVLRTQRQIPFLHLLRAEELVHIPIHSLPNFLRKRRHIAAVGSGSTNMRSSQAEGRPHLVSRTSVDFVLGPIPVFPRQWQRLSPVGS